MAEGKRRAPAARKKKDTSPARQRSRGNSTILIGAQLLSVMARLGGPSPLTRIAEAANLTPSRAYRYLRGLVEGNFIEQDPLSGHYDLGAEALHVGLAALGRIDPCRRAMAVLPELAERTSQIASLTIWGSHGPTVILSEHGAQYSRVRMHEGMVLPLLGTAAGKVFLTFMPPDLIEPFLATEIATWNENHAKAEAMTQARVATLQADVRRNGVAASSGRRDRTHANLAAPVFDHNGRLTLAISLIGVQGNFDTSPNGAAAQELKRTTRVLSDRLGAPRDELPPATTPKRRTLAKV
jgi:DNA-binding IclR family transcriptional regulator